MLPLQNAPREIQTGWRMYKCFGKTKTLTLMPVTEFGLFMIYKSIDS